MLHPIPVSELLRQQSVETRYREADGSEVKDVRPLTELPELVIRIEAEGGELVGVRQAQRNS